MEERERESENGRESRAREGADETFNERKWEEEGENMRVGWGIRIEQMFVGEGGNRVRGRERMTEGLRKSYTK